MDFVPGPSTASYERYVSGSDTDGEGNVSLRDLPRPRRSQHRVRAAGMTTFSGTVAVAASALGKVGREAMTVEDSVLERGDGDPSGGGGSSILMRLAASWKSTAGGDPSVEELHRYRLYKEGEAEGSLWKDTQKSQPPLKTKPSAAAESGDHGGQTAVGAINRRSGFREAFAGLSKGSSSGLKGLQGSLLTNEDGPMTKFNGDAGSSGNGNGGNPVGRTGVRGVWDEAGSGDLEALAAALAPGGDGDVNACAVDGWTALHAAAHVGHAAAVSLLVRSGASTAARAKRGWTPLHSACMRGRSQAVRALLSARADVNARAVDQRTPLHFACEAGSPECTKELLRAGASVNVSDQDARTPLHFACIDGSTECVRRLLAAGASPLPPDAWGRNAAAVARQLNRTGPLRLLEATTSTDIGRKRAANGGASEGSSSPPPPPVKGMGPCNGEEEEDGAHHECDSISNADGGVGSRYVRRWPPVGDGGGGGGSRWVVMNESGRMLERASGKVALFKSMAAAADWANGLKITSGSFQVAELAPSMRKAFAEEVPFEMTGGDTLSEEEDEEKWDPQWTRFRRRQALARKEEKETEGLGRRRRRGAWGVTAQRRDEDEAREIVVAANDKLREVTKERDMHREKTLSLQRALEAVLKECETMAATATSVAEKNSVAAEGAIAMGDDEGAETSRGPASEPDSVSIPAGDVPTSVGRETRTILESRAAQRKSDPGLNVARIADTKDPLERVGDLSASSEISESETDAEVDDDVNEDIISVHGSGDVNDDDDAVTTVTTENTDNTPVGIGEARGGVRFSNSDMPQHSLLSFVEDVDDTPRDGGGGGGTTSSGDAAKQSSWGRAPEAKSSSRGGGDSGNLLEFDDDDGVARRSGICDGDIEGDDAFVVAAQKKKLSSWLSSLEIRPSDALRYADNLVADGFDSGEALKGVREDDLIQYGMKKGHARLVVRTLARGFRL